MRPASSLASSSLSFPSSRSTPVPRPSSAPSPHSRSQGGPRRRRGVHWHLASSLLLASALVGQARAATAAQWEGRTIYQIITDRFAPPSATAPALTSPIPAICDPNDQTWCGGTWRSIIDKLDYIQNMGMDAIWISPVQKNFDGITPYHFAYHGYWVTDQRELNPRFGDEGDLVALSDALHARGMYLMVDIVVNNVPLIADPAVTPITTQLLVDHGYWFQDPAFYHPYCPMDYSNATSEEICWMGDNRLALMDVDTENPTVVSTFETWIAQFVADFKIDGLRIDAAKHVAANFWPGFCAAAGIFCIGEVFTKDIPTAQHYATHMDSIMNYPLYYGMMDAFQLPGPSNISSLVDVMQSVHSSLPNTHVLGTFVENHDLPRFANTTVDPQLIATVTAFQFVTDGIPIVYYGQEQNFHGIADPTNREALWPSGYANTSTVKQIQTLTTARAWLASTGATFRGETFNQATATVLQADTKALAIRKGPVLSILTNRGSPPVNESFALINSGYAPNTALIDIFTCEKFLVGSGSSVLVNYGLRGGRPVVTIPLSMANGSTICPQLAKNVVNVQSLGPPGGVSSGGNARLSTSASTSLALTLVMGGLLLVGSL